jgi:hypothetical protein
VNNFNLVIYTDENSSKHINNDAVYNNPRIKIIIKPITDFHNYKYKDYWIKNHEWNTVLNTTTCWELNMLWSEKISFVKETIENKYFDTEFYGWCDIGYFRNRRDEYIDTPIQELSQWPNDAKICSLDKNRIYYACINNNHTVINQLIKKIRNKNNNNLPIEPIPHNQISIAGGFFLLHKNKISWWFNTFDKQLENYFLNKYLVKDDQIILADCIFTHPKDFFLFKESSKQYDNWFMFQRILI